MTTTSKHPIPPLSLVLAYLPATAILLCGVGALVLPARIAFWAIGGGQLLAAAILFFLAGVRRGLSFFTRGGPRAAQVVTSLSLFGCALVTEILPGSVGFVAAALGYASVAVLDPQAARRGEVPDFFEQLRPPQMAVFVCGCALLFIATILPSR